MPGAAPLDRRVAMAHLPIPLEPLERLGRHLGLAPGPLWVKRDDMTGQVGGGDKARKLAFLCAAALDQGCDTLVTGGGLQSNHVRMTAAAANRLGLVAWSSLPAPGPTCRPGTWCSTSCWATRSCAPDGALRRWTTGVSNAPSMIPAGGWPRTGGVRTACPSEGRPRWGP